MEVINLFYIVDLKGGYTFSGNPEVVFEKFFGTSNPFAQLIGNLLKLITF